ncbi:UNVERIFIED_ORG: hypothetical protein ABIC62_005657 [Burkholderia sp. 1595]|uniref:Uncharacterized protein n=1 Tax=Paraburkholderia terricola TaxID=169427 RepID=A0ABU1LZS7_9BURK|nr:hypothetical protein [Paraburkholderia terricola]
MCCSNSKFHINAGFIYGDTYHAFYRSCALEDARNAAIRGLLYPHSVRRFQEDLAR